MYGYKNGQTSKSFHHVYNSLKTIINPSLMLFLIFDIAVTSVPADEDVIIFLQPAVFPKLNTVPSHKLAFCSKIQNHN
jgi:hypothetical protein